MKVEKAHTVENYLGLPHISGADMQSKSVMIVIFLLRLIRDDILIK